MHEHAIAGRDAAEDTHPHPVWTLGAESETLQPKAHASLTSTLLIGLLVAFLCGVGSAWMRRIRLVGRDQRWGEKKGQIECVWVTPDVVGAYLAANSAGVAARLGSDGAFWLGRSGLLLSPGLLRDGGDGLAGAGRNVGHWMCAVADVEYKKYG